MTSAARVIRRTEAPTNRATAMPLFIGVGSVAVSIVDAVLVLMLVSAPVKVFFGIPMPLVVADAWWLSLLGYVLTPVVVIACYGWDAIAQRAGVRRDVNFSLVTGYSAALRWAVAASVLLGVWHILNLSVPLTESWGLS